MRGAAVKNQAEQYNRAIMQHSQRSQALASMVLSASGFRAVFGGSDDSRSPSIEPVHRDLVAMIVECWQQMLERRVRGRPAVVAVATDTRPTGPAIADTVLRTLVSTGRVEARWLGIAAAPEIMAYTARSAEIDAFVYVSASHNPPGHNGLKIGWEDGGVMERTDASQLIEALYAMDARQATVDSLIDRIAGVSPTVLEELDARREEHKNAALAAYEEQALACGAGIMEITDYRSGMAAGLTDRPLGIVGELNGSARAVSLDRRFLPMLGASLVLHNDRPGQFSHQILPEGAGLEEAAGLLARYALTDSSFQLAYVPDNDGDRGNLVFRDDAGLAVLLDAQTVFAVVVTIELAWARYCQEHAAAQPPGAAPADLVVVANGPTSTRIDQICRLFGARLVRAEVGEANVVHTADRERRAGARVVVLGEGSNGGSIVPPARVRDPLNTLQALMKYRAFELNTLWATVSEQPLADTSLATLATTLPRYCTLATDDPRAKMQVGSTSHAELKARWEAALPETVERIRGRLESAAGSALSWRLINYEGGETRPGPGNRSGKETGGLRLEFLPDETNELPFAWVWMRGSGTEPVFRVLAECAGEDESLLSDLVAWHRDCVEAAISPR